MVVAITVTLALLVVAEAVGIAALVAALRKERAAVVHVLAPHVSALTGAMGAAHLAEACSEARALVRGCEGHFPRFEGKQTDEARHELVARNLTKFLAKREVRVPKRIINAITELAVCEVASGRGD